MERDYQIMYFATCAKYLCIGFTDGKTSKIFKSKKNGRLKNREIEQIERILENYTIYAIDRENILIGIVRTLIDYKAPLVYNFITKHINLPPWQLSKRIGYYHRPNYVPLKYQAEHTPKLETICLKSCTKIKKTVKDQLEHIHNAFKTDQLKHANAYEYMYVVSSTKREHSLKIGVTDDIDARLIALKKKFPSEKFNLEKLYTHKKQLRYSTFIFDEEQKIHNISNRAGYHKKDRHEWHELSLKALHKYFKKLGFKRVKKTNPFKINPFKIVNLKPKVFCKNERLNFSDEVDRNTYLMVREPDFDEWFELLISQCESVLDIDLHNYILYDREYAKLIHSLYTGVNIVNKIPSIVGMLNNFLHFMEKDSNFSNVATLQKIEVVIMLIYLQYIDIAESLQKKLIFFKEVFGEFEFGNPDNVYLKILGTIDSRFNQFKLELN